MEEHHERGFEGMWIPAEIWLDKKTNAREKMLLTIIYHERKGCRWTNSELGEEIGVSKEHIQRMLAKLRKSLHVNTEWEIPDQRVLFYIWLREGIRDDDNE